jgi:hypothetical protein
MRVDFQLIQMATKQAVIFIDHDKAINGRK